MKGPDRQEIVATSSWYERQYQRVMRRMWQHPENTQRPSVLNWLERFQGPSYHVLDIGLGDAYYVSLFRPRHYTIVEPNGALRRLACTQAARLGIRTEVFSAVAELLRTQQVQAADLVLLIHVLLYLQEEEIGPFLSAIAKKPILMVHPSPEMSTTIEFEESLGLTRSRDLIGLKERILGQPAEHQIAMAHFRLALGTNIDDLAFLIAHPLLDGSQDEERLEQARAFVIKRLGHWRRHSYYEIPQAQVLEAYNTG